MRARVLVSTYVSNACVVFEKKYSFNLRCCALFNYVSNVRLKLIPRAVVIGYRNVLI
jgi:hypothetical protein